MRITDKDNNKNYTQIINKLLEVVSNESVYFRANGGTTMFTGGLNTQNLTIAWTKNAPTKSSDMYGATVDDQKTPANPK